MPFIIYRFSNYIEFPFTLRLQLRWSKTIVEEWAYTHQLVLGAMDPLVCVLLNPAGFIELEGLANFPEEDDDFIFGKKAEITIRLCLEEIVSNRDFKDIVKGLLGTHSFRKGSATSASRCDIDRDIVNGRGMWRKNRKQVDTYIDVWQPYPDALVSGKLCGICGACMYALRKLQQANQVSSQFLLDHIAPQVSKRLGDDMALVLALPLLWAAFEDKKFEVVDASSSPTAALLHLSLTSRIITAYQTAYGNLPSTIYNTVIRISIVAQGVGDQLLITELTSEEDNGLAGMWWGPREVVAAGVPGGASQARSNESTTVILYQQLATHRRIEEVK